MSRRSSVLAPLRSAIGGLLEAGLPQTCVACGVWLPAGAGLACSTCHADIRTAQRRSYCPRCGRTLPTTAIHDEHCARCRTEHHWNVAGVVRVGQYTPPIRALVLGLKYRGRERNGDYLADLLALALREQPWWRELDALVPVPMHWLRRLQRPCDHARVLSDALSRRLNVPVLRAVLRGRYAPSQIGLSTRSERFTNVADCFRPPRWARPDVAGRTVCIVDNLLATGATVHEVSKVLRRMGARRIYTAVIARPAAPGDPSTRHPPIEHATYQPS